MTEKKEDYRFKARISFGQRNVDELLCKLFLPQRLADSIRIIFIPNRGQWAALQSASSFSLYGEVIGLSGDVQHIIEADKVYYESATDRIWGTDIEDYIVEAHPQNLTVKSLLLEATQGSDERKISGSFWLTPSKFLTPYDSRTLSYTGEVKLRSAKPKAFSLDENIKLTFKNYYDYLEGDNNETITIPRLVAEYGPFQETFNEEQNLESLDAFLLLTSVAERKRCVCLGWDRADNQALTKYYRREISIPKPDSMYEFQNELIPYQYYWEYIHTTYNNFIECSNKDLMCLALYGLLPVSDHTISDNVMSLYSSIESLILYHCKTGKHDRILAPSEWKDFHRDLKKFVKTHSTFSTEEYKRKLVYKKLGELNRVSFSDILESFCSQYSLDLSDLWPLNNNKDGMSLAEIRNHVVHGEVFNNEQYFSMATACLHMKCILERMSLCVLGWPYESSTVGNGALTEQVIGNPDWQKDRDILSK